MDGVYKEYLKKNWMNTLKDVTMIFSVKEMETSEKSKEIFEKLCEEYPLEDIRRFSREVSDLMWKKRAELHVEEIKSQRKGAILQVGSGSHAISGERVKLLRKNPRYAEVKVMTGRKYKRTIWKIAYSWLKTDLTDLKEARMRSETARNASRMLNRLL